MIDFYSERQWFEKKKLMLVSGLFFLCFYGFPLYSVDLSVKKVESEKCVDRIDDLMELGFRTYPGIQLSRLGISGAEKQMSGALSSFLPTPSIDVSQGAGRRGTTLRLEQPIWTGGKLDAMYDIALSKKNEAKYSLDEAGYGLMENILFVLKNYAEARGNFTALAEGKKQLEDLEQMLNRRIEAGVSASSDRELIRERLIQINTDIEVVVLKRNSARAQLELLVGKKINCDIGVEEQSILSENLSIEAMIEKMLSSHPTLKRLVAQVQTATAENSKAKAAVWPNVVVRAERTKGSVYSDRAEDNSLVYMNLQMSTGAGLTALYSIQSAEIKILQAESEKSLKERQLSNEMIRDYEEFKSADSRKEGLLKSIEASKNVLESYKRMFVAGKRQWLDLVNASRELTQSRVNQSNLQASYVILAYKLALRSGEIKMGEGNQK